MRKGMLLLAVAALFAMSSIGGCGSKPAEKSDEGTSLPFVGGGEAKGGGVNRKNKMEQPEIGGLAVPKDK